VLAQLAVASSPLAAAAALESATSGTAGGGTAAAGTGAGAGSSVAVGTGSATSAGTSALFGMSIGGALAAGALLATSVIGVGWYVASAPKQTAAQQPVMLVASKAPAVGGETAAVIPKTPRAELSPVGSARADAEADALPLEGKALKSSSPRSTHSQPLDLDAELRLISAAQDALRRGDAAAALATLEQHRLQHPSGALTLEREALRAEALCRSGRVGEGKSLAARFAAQHPDSPLVHRLSTACSL
jgi:hypothetical protein